MIFNMRYMMFLILLKNDSKWKNIDNQASKYHKLVEGDKSKGKKLTTKEKFIYIKKKDNHQVYLDLNEHNKLYQCYKALRKHLKRIKDENDDNLEVKICLKLSKEKSKVTLCLQQTSIKKSYLLEKTKIQSENNINNRSSTENNLETTNSSLETNSKNNKNNHDDHVINQNTILFQYFIELGKRKSFR